MPWTNSLPESPQKDEVMNMVDRTLFHFGYSLTTETWQTNVSNSPQDPAKSATNLILPEYCPSPSQCGKTLAELSTLLYAASALLSCFGIQTDLPAFAVITLQGTWAVPFPKKN